MKKYYALILALLLFCAITACDQQEQPEQSSNNTVNDVKESTESKIEDKQEISEAEALQEILNLIAPITDYSLLSKVNDFYSVAIPASLNSHADSVMENLLNIQSDANLIIDAILESEMPEGYGLKDNWDDLTGSCISLKSNLQNAIEALRDNDSSRVMELRESVGNTDVVEEALVIQKVLSGKLTEILENEEKQDIEVVVSYEECVEKAAKYARYHFENPYITGDDLQAEPTPVVVDDIPGKHYAFYFDNIIIFINVEDSSIVCREVTADGYKDNYVNDGVLPAEDDDIVMPDIIGMNYEKAKELLESMGITYSEGGGMDTDAVPEGSVAHCYPSPGNAVLEDTVVSILKEIDVAN